MSKWHDTLFDAGLRTEFLANYGLSSAGAVALFLRRGNEPVSGRGAGRAHRGLVTTPILDLAKSAGVAYALTWQTYYDGSDFDNKAVYYYVPLPGHPEADNFRRFAGRSGGLLRRDSLPVAPARRERNADIRSRREAASSPRPRGQVSRFRRSQAAQTPPERGSSGGSFTVIVAAAEELPPSARTLASTTALG